MERANEKGDEASKRHDPLGPTTGTTNYCFARRSAGSSVPYRSVMLCPVCLMIDGMIHNSFILSKNNDPFIPECIPRLIDLEAVEPA
jgi:hypothetical protein